MKPEKSGILNWTNKGDKINAAISNSNLTDFQVSYMNILNSALSKLPNTNKTLLYRASGRPDVVTWATNEIKTWETFYASTHNLQGIKTL